MCSVDVNVGERVGHDSTSVPHRRVGTTVEGRGYWRMCEHRRINVYIYIYIYTHTHNGKQERKENHVGGTTPTSQFLRPMIRAVL